MSGLQIPNSRERAIVHAADVVLRPLAWFRRRAPDRPVGRVLLLRLERIGDLLMVLDAIADARAAWPDAEIDLAVGSWNLSIARLIPGIRTIQTVDVRGSRATAAAMAGPRSSAGRVWRSSNYDLVINLEPTFAVISGVPDGAPARHGAGLAVAVLSSLTPSSASPPDMCRRTRAHSSGARLRCTGRRRVDRGQAHPTRGLWCRRMQRRANALLAQARRPLIGVRPAVGANRSNGTRQVRGCRARARQVARRDDRLDGRKPDRPLVDAVAAQLGGISKIDVCERSISSIAAVVAARRTSREIPARCTCGAVSTPVVALFGPADPRRYGHRSLQRSCASISVQPVRLVGSHRCAHVPTAWTAFRGYGVAATLEVLDEAGTLRQTAND